MGVEVVHVPSIDSLGVVIDGTFGLFFVSQTTREPKAMQGDTCTVKRRTSDRPSVGCPLVTSLLERQHR